MPLTEKVERADLIAVVQVTSKSWQPNLAEKLLRRQARLRVLTLYKGTAEDPEVLVGFEEDFICSGNRYVPSEEWLVFLARVRPGVYRTVNLAGGQVQPRPSTLAQVKKLTGKEVKVNDRVAVAPPAKHKIPDRVTSASWIHLNVSGVRPGMTPAQVVAAVGKPDKKAGDGSWWYWNSDISQVRFGSDGRVSGSIGGGLRLRTRHLMGSASDPSLLEALGTPSQVIGDWHVFRQHGRTLAIEVAGESLYRFCLFTEPSDVGSFLVLARLQ